MINDKMIHMIRLVLSITIVLMGLVAGTSWAITTGTLVKKGLLVGSIAISWGSLSLLSLVTIATLFTTYRAVWDALKDETKFRAFAVLWVTVMMLISTTFLALAKLVGGEG